VVDNLCHRPPCIEKQWHQAHSRLGYLKGHTAAGSSLDKIFFQADSLTMFRKCLALLLVLTWVILFGTVVLENLDGFGSQLHRSAHAPTWSAKPAAVLTDDIVESAGHIRLSQCKWVKATTTELPAIGLTSLPRYFKLHKVHHVFLI
jgi:hypothetical protein